MPNRDEYLDRIEIHRLQIDEIDRRLVALLNERATHQMAIRSIKAEARLPVYDQRREDEVIERVHAQNAGPLTEENLNEIFEAILTVSKEMQSS